MQAQRWLQQLCIAEQRGHWQVAVHYIAQSFATRRQRNSSHGDKWVKIIASTSAGKRSRGETPEFELEFEEEEGEEKEVTVAAGDAPRGAAASTAGEGAGDDEVEVDI